MEGKPRIIIWLVSNDINYIGNALNILERQFNGIEIVGVTASREVYVKYKVDKVISFIPLNEISVNGGGYDIILVAGAKGIGMSEITKFARAIKLDTKKLLGDWIVCIPGFTLQKYRQLQRSKLSIFSINCFGGKIYHTLGLPFNTPFINMFMRPNEFIRLLRSPRVYMEEKVIYLEDALESHLKVLYPVATLGNVSLHFNHYKNFNEAQKKWNERKQKINWYNIMVETYTDDVKILEQFDELPYSKKVCFVPFKSDLDSAFYVNPSLMPKEPFWRIINLYALGSSPFFYDMFDMLLYGKKSPLIKM